MADNGNASSRSVALGFVKSPLSAPQSVRNETLEVRRLELAASDSFGPYEHSGAAIYYVESGSVGMTLENTANTGVFLSTLESNEAAMPQECSSGCTYSLQGRQWISFENHCRVTVMNADAPAVVIVTSLTLPGGLAEFPRPTPENPQAMMVVIQDARNPLLPPD